MTKPLKTTDELAALLTEQVRKVTGCHDFTLAWTYVSFDVRRPGLPNWAPGVARYGKDSEPPRPECEAALRDAVGRLQAQFDAKAPDDED